MDKTLMANGWEAPGQAAVGPVPFHGKASSADA